MRFSSFDPVLNGHLMAEEHSNIDFGSDYAEIPELFEKTEFDLWGRLDIDELPLKENTIELLQPDDGSALVWLYSYNAPDW